ncbi:MAG TPA: GDP-mannose 4,6-dehydratase, partial [Bryobacterales bacterium]|nr:GDP-mannose 4,6-dehydratase [Bryobacterales bacterium]
MPKFLITGGAGFIGSHLAERLLALGQRVAVLDNLSTGSVSNVTHLRSNPGFQFVMDEVSNERVLAELVDEADVVFHLAATVGVQKIIDSPVETIVNNVHGTETVLNAVAKKRRKIIVASTSEVYGKSAALPFREDGDLVLGPTSKARWSYACSKAIDEFMAIAYWREKQTPAVVARLFNTIGPRQSGQYGMVVPRFIAQALDGKDITVYGDGRQTRSFTYVEDVVAWLILLAQDDRAVGEIFNLGNPNEVTITALGERIIRLTGSSSRIRYVPYDEAYESGFEDMGRREPDISKVVSLTGLQPRVDLDEALRRTIGWFRERRQEEK